MATRGAVAWTIATTLVGALCQLLQLAIAARFLDANQFGALAIVNVTSLVILAFQEMGLSSFSVHVGEMGRRSNATLFWISTGLGAAGASLVFLLSAPIALFYDLPRLSGLLQLVSVNLLLIGIGTQYQAHYVRVFRAKHLAQMELVARLLGFVVAVTLLVVARHGPEAIVWGALIFSSAKLLFMACFAAASWHPCLEFDRSLAPRALRYGSYQAASQLISQLRTQADQLILGKVLGADALGIYSIAKELINYPMRVLQPLLSRIALPIFAKHQNNVVELRTRVLQNMRVTASFCAIVYAALALLAPWISELLYGEKYQVVAIYIPYMVLFGAIRPLGLTIGMLAQAIGNTRNEFRWNLLVAIFTVIPNLTIGYFAPSLINFSVMLSAVQLMVTLLAYPFFLRPLVAVGMKSYINTWGTQALITILVILVAKSGWISLTPLKPLLGQIPKLF